LGGAMVPSIDHKGATALKGIINSACRGDSAGLPQPTF
jgi:hypothetical protein